MAARQPFGPNPSESIGRGTTQNQTRGAAFGGKRYHIEIALVDRRLHFRVDGRDVFARCDLPEPKDRAP